MIANIHVWSKLSDLMMFSVLRTFILTLRPREAVKLWCLSVINPHKIDSTGRFADCLEEHLALEGYERSCSRSR